MEKERTQEIIDMLKENPFPSINSIREWVIKKGYNFDDVERVAFGLATYAVQLITEGKSKEEEKKRKIPKDQIEKGIEVEQEHTSNKLIARKIALDHLYEFPNYYTALDTMEEMLRRDPKYFEKLRRKESMD
ncbi:MAG: DUF5661 family protein [Candidatus Paceibacterota bacterium]|jgi:hypothetical protein